MAEHVEQERQFAALRQKYPDDALGRLVRANPDYYNSHGSYLPELAQLLLYERAAYEDRSKAFERAAADCVRLEEDSKGWQAEWSKVIHRERALRRCIAAAQPFVDDDEWQEHASELLSPAEAEDEQHAHAEHLREAREHQEEKHGE